MTSSCVKEKSQIKLVSDVRKVKLSADERLNIMEDCVDVLSLFVSKGRILQQQNKLKAVVHLDIVYRTGNGQLSSVRRTVEIESDWDAANFSISSVRLTDVYLRPDAQYLDCHMSFELNCIVYGCMEIEKLVSVSLNEDEVIPIEDFPTVSLVRCSGESLWELAKNYCSSVEKIKASNSLEGDICGRMILIPKSI